MSNTPNQTPTQAQHGADPAEPPRTPSKEIEQANADRSELHMMWLKEWTTVVLAVGIAAVTLGLLVTQFNTLNELHVTPEMVDEPTLLSAMQAAHEAAVTNRLNVINTTVAILGVVTGYFFGRVPVERRAQQAENIAKANAEVMTTATKDKLVAEAKTADAQATLDRVQRKVEDAADRRQTLGLDQAADVSALDNEVLAELRALQRRLSR